MKALVEHLVNSAWNAGLYRVGARWLRADRHAHRLAKELSVECAGHRTADQILASAAARANEILWDRTERRDAA